MTEIKLRASDLIGVSVFNPVCVKSTQPSGCQWEAEGTSLSVFCPGQSFAVPSHESAGTTWLSDGRVYLALLRSSRSSWVKKKKKKVVFQFCYFYNLIFQLVSTTHAEPLPSKTHCDSCLGLACDFHGSGGPGGAPVGAQLLEPCSAALETCPAFAQRQR